MSKTVQSRHTHRQKCELLKLNHFITRLIVLVTYATIKLTYLKMQ